MNDFDLCLEVLSRSCQPLRYMYIRRWISRKSLEIEAWVKRTTNRKWHMGYQMVTWPMTSRDPPKVLWGSTVGCPSDSLASCWKSSRHAALRSAVRPGDARLIARSFTISIELRCSILLGKCNITQQPFYNGSLYLSVTPTFYTKE